MSQLDDAFFFAETLSPEDRLQLIAQLWASLPPQHWAAPSAAELVELKRRLAEHDAGRADLPWEIVNRLLINHAAVVRGKIYSAPRRFDLATIFAVTSAYSVLFGVMTWLGVPPLLICSVAAFITFVGLGQALLFAGNWPRLASILAGIAVSFVEIAFYPGLVGEFHIGSYSEQVAFAFVFAVALGGVLGYLAGVLVGGVFLIADLIRQRYGSTAARGELRADAKDIDVDQLHPLDAGPVAHE